MIELQKEIDEDKCVRCGIPKRIGCHHDAKFHIGDYVKDYCGAVGKVVKIEGDKVFCSSERVISEYLKNHPWWCIEAVIITKEEYEEHFR